MDTMTTNNETMTGQDVQAEDGKLRAEAARRRIAAKEANERADAAEATAAELRAQIAELKLAQARTAVTAAHPELTTEMIEAYAPANVDADGLEDWAEKTLALVVALRGEAVVDENAMTDEARQLAETQLELAKVSAVSENEHVTAEIIDTLCAETTPEGLAEWAAEFERLTSTQDAFAKAYPQTKASIDRHNMSKVSPGKWVGAGNGLENVARRLKR